jgi:hypothetical protein
LDGNIGRQQSGPRVIASRTSPPPTAFRHATPDVIIIIIIIIIIIVIIIKLPDQAIASTPSAPRMPHQTCIVQPMHVDCTTSISKLPTRTSVVMQPAASCCQVRHHAA